MMGLGADVGRLGAGVGPGSGSDADASLANLLALVKRGGSDSDDNEAGRDEVAS
jgi:hypothetical protein